MNIRSFLNIKYKINNISFVLNNIDIYLYKKYKSFCINILMTMQYRHNDRVLYINVGQGLHNMWCQGVNKESQPE